MQWFRRRRSNCRMITAGQHRTRRIDYTNTHIYSTYTYDNIYRTVENVVYCIVNNSLPSENSERFSLCVFFIPTNFIIETRKFFPWLHHCQNAGQSYIFICAQISQLSENLSPFFSFFLLPGRFLRRIKSEASQIGPNESAKPIKRETVCDGRNRAHLLALEHAVPTNSATTFTDEEFSAHHLWFIYSLEGISHRNSSFGVTSRERDEASDAGVHTRTHKHARTHKENQRGEVTPPLKPPGKISGPWTVASAAPLCSSHTFGSRTATDAPSFSPSHARHALAHAYAWKQFSSGTLQRLPASVFVALAFCGTSRSFSQHLCLKINYKLNKNKLYILYICIQTY